MGNLHGTLHVEGDLAVGSNINIEGDAQDSLICEGDLAAGGSVSANNSLTIGGDLASGGSIMIMNGLTCSGNIEGDVKTTGDIHVGGSIWGNASSQDGRIDSGHEPR